MDSEHNIGESVDEWLAIDALFVNEGAEPYDPTMREIAESARIVLELDFKKKMAAKIFASGVDKAIWDVDRMGSDSNKIAVAVDAFFDQIHFTDTSVSAEEVYRDYADCVEDKGVVPFSVEDKQLDILRNVSKEGVPEEAHKVVGFSLGGTNIDLAAAEISIDGTVDSKALCSKKFDGGNYSTADNFWNAVFPDNFREVLKSSVDNQELFMGVTIAHPVEDGYLRPGKYNCPALTNGTVKIEDSLKDFIVRQGIVDEKNLHIVVSPNDTRSTLLANFRHFSKFSGKHIGAFILGTGVNASLKGQVTEMGDYRGFRSSMIDRMEPNAEFPITMDGLVAGGKLGHMFKFAVSMLCGKDSRLAKMIMELSDDEAKRSIFDFAYGNAIFWENISDGEKVFLECLAKKFTSRIVHYVSTMLIGFVQDIEEDTVLFVDGSLVTKNPQLLDEINSALPSKVQLVMSELDVKGEAADKIKDDSSLVGTMMFAMAERLLVQKETRLSRN